MKFKILAVFMLLIICFTFIVPFASAETVTEDGAQFIFHELHSSRTYSPGSATYYVDNDNGFFGLGYVNISSFSTDFAFIDFPNFSFEFSMNNSPYAYFGGNYALFTPKNFAGGSIQINSNPDFYFDNSLHSLALIFAVPVGFPYDIQDILSFSNVDTYDDTVLTKLNVDILSSSGGLSTIEIDGSSPSTSTGNVPSFSFYSQYTIDDEFLPLMSQFELYVLTWYHTPTFFNMTFLYTPTSMADQLFVLSFIDMVSVNTGYETGYREGFALGQEQANNTVNTGSASYTAGYDDGYSDGQDTGYTEGYDEGYGNGVHYANTHVNESSASYIQGKYDGVESANQYTFLGLISAIIDAPIRAIFGYTTVENGVEIQHGGLLTFEVFGQDMSNFVLSIFSIAVVLCIIRIIRGG